jgi:hypothetical protein
MNLLSSTEDPPAEKQALKLEIELNFASLLDLGKKYYSTLYSNLFHLSGSYTLSSSHQKLKNTPAIICGAGPSLEKNFSYLQKYSSNALIFSTGTAMPIMAKNKLPYHFGFGIDPNSPKRIHDALNPSPLFCTTCYATDNFQTYPYPKILIGNFGELPWEEQIEKELHLSLEKIDYGYNVTTFAVAVAHYLGCSPIILVGVDLCYEKNKYSSKIKENRHYETYPAYDRNQKKVLTQKDWLLVKIWLERFAKKNPSLLMNASNGLKLEQIPFIQWDQLDLLPLAFSNPQEEVLSTCSKIVITKKQLKLFFQSHLDHLLYMQDIIQKDAFQRDWINFNLDQFENFPFYSSFFIPFWTIFQTSFQTLQPKNISEDEKKLHEKAQKIAFLKNILQTHIPLLKEYQEQT